MSLYRAEAPVHNTANGIFDLVPPIFRLTLDKEACSEAQGLSRASCTVPYTENACLVYQEQRRRPLGPKSQNAYKLVLHTVTRKLLIAIQ